MTERSGANEQQGEYWQARAPEWIEAVGTTAIVLDPYGEAAMDRLALGPGERVLDIGCGTGETTAALASRVGPDGSALGVDIAPDMIATSQDRNRDSAATFAVADVQVDDLGGQRFDAAFSRFGVMFFADPAAAFANIRRLLTPGGRLAFACWQERSANEWMSLPVAALIEAAGVTPPPPAPGDPGPCSLADRDLIEHLLTAAGFVDIEIVDDQRMIDLPESRLEQVVALSSGVGAVREAVRRADGDLAARILAAVREAVEAKVSDGRVRLTSAAYVVSARATA
jgi:SAM-dependent methyltransferase